MSNIWHISPLVIGSILTELTFWKQVNIFLQKFWALWKCREERGNFLNVLKNKVLVVTWSSLLQHFVNHQSISPIVQENKKPGQLHYASKFNGFVWAVFCIFILGQKLTLLSFHCFLLVVCLQKYFSFLNEMNIFSEILMIIGSVATKKKILRQSEQTKICS